MGLHLPLPLLVEGKKVIQCPVVYAPPLILLNVGASHGVSLARACLTVCKYADIVACIHRPCLRHIGLTHCCDQEQQCTNLWGAAAVQGRAKVAADTDRRNQRCA